MNAPGLAAVALVAGLLAALFLELWPGGPAAPTPLAAPRAAPVVAAATPAARSDLAADAVQTLLARPLFSATRRPPTGRAVADTGAAPMTLPRMTAILIDGPRRSAIFAPAGGKPMVVTEGAQVGPFTVQRIDPQGVTVVGPEGTRTVRTSFDPSLPPPTTPLGLQPPVGIAPAFPPPAPPLAAGSGLTSLSGAAR